ncbi:S-methyl-5-thioribose kinase [Brachyspira aalborgi]|uniref:S-methyl-5-thioribose kinase n=1 Tax=Brachyspira aalborgi TaxID=29522 RepID=A0A5C8EQT4_9SPIR|nr:S-methyl-5-thioribose kinase [Brachyspira aalborgi]TXJ39748.1 S-methyl-5-thioribose kinase [Brachyspira aalborgi]
MNKFNKYFLMNEKDILEYSKEKLKYFDSKNKITCKEIGDGNLNYVYRVKNNKKSVIIKQAGVHTRSNSSGRILDINRNKKEAEILTYYGKKFPKLAPKIFYIDETMKLFIMEDLKDCIILRDALIKGKILYHLPEQITDFIIETTLSTADFFTDAFSKKNEVIKYTNKELCKISEELVFTEPFFNLLKENVFSKRLKKYVEKEFYKNKKLQFEAAKLKYEFMNNPQALIHGDLHTGSIFTNDKYIKVMDCEFAFYGPIGYDLGTLIANLIFSYVYHLNITNNKKFMRFIYNAINDIIKLFKKKFLIKFKKDIKDISAKNEEFKKYYLDNVLKYSFGICGLEIIRRTTGCARVKEIESVSDEKKRADIEYNLLKIGKEVIMQREKLIKVADFTNWLKFNL